MTSRSIFPRMIMSRSKSATKMLSWIEKVVSYTVFIGTAKRTQMPTLPCLAMVRQAPSQVGQQSCSLLQSPFPGHWDLSWNRRLEHDLLSEKSVVQNRINSHRIIPNYCQYSRFQEFRNGQLIWFALRTNTLPSVAMCCMVVVKESLASTVGAQ